MNKNFFLTVTALAIMFTVGYAAYTNGSIGDLGQVINNKVSEITSVGSSFLAQSSTSDVWTPCANENGTCSFSGTKQVRYGSNNKYAYGMFSNGVTCNNVLFGYDPAPNVLKGCDFSDLTVLQTSSPAPAPATTSTWTDCATEGGICNIVGIKRVRFGANESYLYYTTSGSSQMEAVVCTSAVFGSDPAPGVGKKCSYEGDVAVSTPRRTTPCSDVEYSRAVDLAFKATYAGGDNGVLLESCKVYAREHAVASRVSETPVVTNVWTKCANEGGACSFYGTTRQVRYGGTYKSGVVGTKKVFGFIPIGQKKGTEDDYVYYTYTNEVKCNKESFQQVYNATSRTCSYAGVPDKPGNVKNIPFDTGTTRVDGVAAIFKFKITAQRNNADHIRSMNIYVTGKGVEYDKPVVLRVFSDEKMTQPIGNAGGYEGQTMTKPGSVGVAKTFVSSDGSPLVGIEPGSTVFFSLEASLKRAKERSNITSKLANVVR